MKTIIKDLSWVKRKGKLVLQMLVAWQEPDLRKTSPPPPSLDREEWRDVPTRN